MQILTDRCIEFRLIDKQIKSNTLLSKLID